MKKDQVSGLYKQVVLYCCDVVDTILEITGNETRERYYARALSNDDNYARIGATELKLSLTGKKTALIENRLFCLLQAEYGEALLITWLAALSRNGSVLSSQLNVSEQQWSSVLHFFISNLLSTLTKRLRLLRKCSSQREAETLFAILNMLWQAVDVMEKNK